MIARVDTLIHAKPNCPCHSSTIPCHATPSISTTQTIDEELHLVCAANKTGTLPAGVGGVDASPRFCPPHVTDRMLTTAIPSLRLAEDSAGSPQSETPPDDANRTRHS